MTDTVRKSIILVDFDNIFSALWQRDRDLAMLFGGKPLNWLTALASRHPDDVSRRWLVARCYLNPNGSVQRSDSERVFLSHFRASLVRAGFEIVDCPLMARGGKNAADIRIVIDALDLLGGNVRYDEFVIASGDSDFAPLLHRIRASDRASVIVAPGQASPAYTSLADAVIGYDALEALIRGDQAPTENIEATSADQEEAGRIHFARFIRARYDAATAPLNISSLSQQAELAMPGARAAKWFGAPSFTAAVVMLDLPNIAFSQHQMWDTGRHAPPVCAEPPEHTLTIAMPALLRILDVPALPQDVWPKVFQTIADYAAAHDFELAEATRWCRDTLAVDGHAVARSTLNFVVRGLLLCGTPLDRTPPPTADEIGRAFCDNLLSRARGGGTVVDPAIEADLASWLGVDRIDDAA